MMTRGTLSKRSQQQGRILLDSIPGVVMLLQLAISDYAEGVPSAIGTILNMRMPDFIDALCPDEESQRKRRS